MKSLYYKNIYNYKILRSAKEALDGFEMDGRDISIVYAKERRKTPNEMRHDGGYRRDGDSRGGRRNSRDRGRGRSRSRDRDRSRDRGRERDRRDRDHSDDEDDDDR